MIINYNSLSRGRDAWLKNDVGEVAGSPPGSSTKALKMSWLMNLLLFAILLTGSIVNAQTGIANYAFSSTTGATYTPITGGTVHTSGAYDNQVSTAITMGGTFTYGGVAHTTCYISANGYITFGAAPGGTNYTPLSTLGTTTGAISAFGQDGGGSTVSGAAPEVRYESIGGEFVVQYKDHASWSNRATERLNFQIRLNYTTGAVNIIYGTNTNPGSTNSASQVGIRGASTTYADNVNNLYIANMPTTTTCDWSNAVSGNSNSSSMYFSSTNLNVKIPTGLTYTWTPSTAAPVRTFSAITGVTPNAATVSWTAPAGATSYNVQYRTMANCAWTNWSGNPVATNSVTLAGLTANTSYQVRIQANNGTANSIYSHIPNTAGTGDGYNLATGSFTTLQDLCTGTPSGGAITPTAYTVCSGVTPSSMTVTGATTGASGLTYQWEQSTDNGATWISAVGGSGSTTATYTPPSYAGAVIQYRAARICSGSGLIGYSNAVTINPVVAPTTQATALNVITSPSQLYASWTVGNGGRRMVVISNAAIVDPVNGSAAALTTNTAYSGSGQQIVFDGTGTSVTVTGLTCNTTYYVKVYDYNRCGSGPYTYTYNLTTGTNAATVVGGPMTGSLPATANLTGFTGSNLHTAFPGWYEAKGTVQNLNPTGITSEWTNTTLGGFTTAKINLYTTSRNEWIVGPKLAITANSRFIFKAAITDFGAITADPARMQGTDDKVKVLISTDGCGAAWTTLYTFEAANTTTLTNALTEFIVDIPSSYIGQTVQLAFQATDGPTDDSPDYDFHVTDFRIELTPSCIAPTGVNLTSSTATTANLSWTASSSLPADGYEWEVRTSGAAGTAGYVTNGSVLAGVTTAAVGSLTANTTYSFYIRSHCGAGSYSAWTSATVFTTPCASTGVPYTLDFESAVVPAIPACTAIQNAGTGNNWITASAPGSGFTSKTLRYSYNSSNAANAWFYTQGVNLVANTTYSLSYKYGANSAYVEKLKVAYATTPAAASMTTVLADHTSITGTTPATNSVYFTPTVSGTYYFGFNAYSIADQNGLFVDDIAVNLAPSCIPPSALTVSANAATANLSWTASINVPSGGYDWEVRTAGTAGSGGAGLAASGNVATTTVAASVLPLTTYTAYVRSNCGSSDTSTWIASASFTTPCAISNVPYVQNFSTAVVPALPGCTSSQNLGFGGGWTTEDEVYSGLFPASQGNYLVYYYDEDYTGNAWFYTNAINLTGGVEYAISYKYGNDNSPTYPERMKVAYGTSATSTAMTNPLADYSSITTANNTAFILFTPATTGVYYFGFNAYSAPDMDLLQLDDIKIDLAPTCRVPSALNITTGVNTASFTWTAPTTGASGYEWAVTTSDVPPASGTASAGTSASTGSLLADTFYYLHVRSTCGGTDKSDWVSKLFITGYCLSTSTIPGNGHISSFVTTGGTANISNTSTNDPRGYSNFSSMVASNHEGVSTAFTLTPSTGSLYLYGATIFIDWNNDLDFDDPNERVYSAATSTSTSPRTGSITIPAGTPLGNYRMRVKIDYINYATQISACGNIQVGETEDYTFTVLPVPPVITSFTPASLCSNDLATTVVTLTGTNFTGVTEVKLDDVVTPFTVNSATSISVNLTASSRSGFFSLYKSGDGSSTVSASPIEVTLSPEVAAITGPTSVCLPNTNTITLENETPTGVWSSSNVDVATVNSGGIVTPVSAGTAIISFTVTDSGCSTAVTHSVKVNDPIVITASTATQTVVTGGNTSFSVTATGSGAPSESGLTYQWQSTVDGDNFTTLTNDAIYGGTNTSTLTLTNVPETMNLTLYNVIISGACTTEVSDLAVLFVGDTGIDVQPSPVAICASGSGTASFTVEASSDVTAYEWQEDQGGDNWQVLSDGGMYSGTNTTTLSLSGLTVANNGWKYKVVVTGIGSAESNPVALTVSQGAVVTTPPANQTVCYSGGSASFTVAATNAASYQWQYSADGGTTWDNAANGLPVGTTYSGTALPTLNVTTTAALSGTVTHLYRALVNSATPCAAVTSTNAQLNVNTPAVTLQPVPVTINAGATAAFTVNATGMTTPTYQWQFATTAGGTYTDVANGTPVGITYTGATTNNLSVATANTMAASSALYYKVIVSSGVGCTVESSPAQLTVRNYCTPNASTSTSSYLSAFAISGGVTNISNTSAYSASGYGNFTNLSASQLQGQSVNFSTTTVGGTVGVSIWVDWNQNATFEAGERVFNTTGFVTSPTGSFTVPAGALPGNTRMRVLMDWNTANLTDPCLITTTSPRGEVEDYSFVVLVPPPCSTPVAGTITASPSSICTSGSTVLTATGYTTGQTGITFQWYNSAGPISGQTGFTYTTPTLTASESYYFRATCANGNVIADSNTLNIVVNSPVVTSTTPASRCGSGTVNLVAAGTSGSVLNWYAAASGGVPIGTGSPFTTPVISANTNYYVASEYPTTGSAAIGTATTLTASTFAPTAFNNYNAAYHAQYLVTAAELNAAGLTAGNITSVAFNITTIGSSATNANFKVAIAPTALTALTSTYVTAGLATVYGPSTYTHAVGVNTVNFATPYNWDGLSNIIVDVTHEGANSSLNAVTYYTATTPVTVIYGSSLTSTTGTTSTSRLNMTFQGAKSCSSARTLVAATVTTAPAFAVSRPTTTICAGSVSEALTVTQGAADYNTYSWSPATGVSGTALTGFTFSPSTTTTYTLTVSQSGGANCGQVVTHVVTVNPMPLTPVISPANTTICAGATQALSIGTSSMTAGTATFGTGTSSASTTSYPNPLSAYYGGAKHQMLYTVAELNAQGLQAGSIINTVSLTMNAFTASACTNFTIRMGTTASNTLTGFVTGTSNVYGPTTFTPSAVGAANFTLTTPYVWNGTSNLVVEMVHNAGNSGNGSGTTVLYTTTTGNTVYFGASDTISGGISGFDALTAYDTYGASSSRPNTVFGHMSGALPTWAPVAGLYTDAAGTIAYTGDKRATIYAKPSANATYTATVTTAALCSVTSAAASITVNQFYNFYVDNDGDNYGTGPAVSLCAASASEAPTGYAVLNGDCDDTLSTVHPGAVEIPFDGLDNNCDGQMDENGKLTTKLFHSSCGTTLAAIGSVILIQPVSNQPITGYRIRIANGSQVQTIYKNVPRFTLLDFPIRDYATTYTVDIELERNGVFLGYYGETCLVSTPAVLEEGGATSISPTQCGEVLPSIKSLIYTTSLNGVTGYRFRVTDITPGVTNGAVQTIDRTTHWFSMQMLASYTYNATYMVEVAVKTTGAYSSFGAPCNVRTPQVGLSNCDEVMTSVTSQVKAMSVNGGTQYRFQVSRLPNLDQTVTLDRPSAYFNFTMVPGFTPGAQYFVRVAVMTANTWSVLGDGCEVTAPGTLAGPAKVSMDAFVDFTATAFPNPYSHDFGIKVTTSNADNLQVRVYDMLGKLIEAREVKVSDLEGLKVGDRYAAGVYNVIVSQGADVKTLRVIKR